MIRVWAGPLAVFALNIAICWRLFKIEFFGSWHSIEGVYIGLARLIHLHFPDLQWFPEWYGGIPFQNTYPPLMHLLVAALSVATRWSESSSYHYVCAVSYSLGAVAAYWLARRLFASETAAFSSAIFYSLLSTSAFVMPSVWTDLGGWQGPRRFYAMAWYGEGPQVMSMTLMTVALAIAARTNRPHPVWAALAFASVPLTNWIGGFTLAIALLCFWISWFGAHTRWLISAGMLAYGLACTWLPPSTIQTIRANAPMLSANFKYEWRSLWIGLAIITTVVAMNGMLRRRASVGLRFALGLAIVTGAITLLAEHWGIKIIPQPERYHLAMELAVSLILGWLFALAWNRAALPVRVALAVVFACLALSQWIQYRRGAHSVTPRADVTRTLYAEAPRAIDRLFPGDRVMTTGAIAFWYHAFGNNPQIRGGFENGVTNRRIPDLNFVSTFVKGNGDIAAAWMRVYGVRAVLVGGPNTEEHYRDWKDPSRFQGILPEVWRRGDDVLYAVPAVQRGLAHVVRPSELVQLAVFYNMQSMQQIAAYHSAIEDPQRAQASLRWINRHHAVIDARLAPGEVISVQLTADPGWRVSQGRTRADGLGLLVIEPDCQSSCHIELEYTGGPEMLLARIATACAAAVCLFLVRKGR